MSVFSYQVRERSGRALRGTIEAESRAAAASLLRQQGYLVTRLEEQARSKAVKGRALVIFRSRVRLSDLVLFTKQLSVMIRAGIPVVQALRTASRQAEKPVVKDIINNVAAQVESGTSLAEAVRKHPKVFPQLYGHMIEAGETGGMLDSVLDQLSAHLEKELQLRQKIIGAVTYPAVVLAFAMLVVVLVVTFLVPQFGSMFQSMNADLPVLTRVLLNISELFRSWGSFILPALAGIGFGMRVLLRTEFGRKWVDYFVLQVPVFGPLERKVTIARFSRTLGMLLGGGIPMLQCLDIAAQVSSNVVIGAAIQKAMAGVRQGSGISRPLEETGLFPPMVTGMIAVGEESGQLETMLAEIADFYEMEVETVVSSLTTLLEPFLLIGLGVIVALIVASILMPMFGMMNAVSI